MKILIVNAHPPTPKGQKDFLEFRYLVQKSFLEQNELLDTETEFIIRDATSIMEFLYEIPSSWVNQHAIKAFNHFDMVFISGCGTILPWSPYMERILVLLRMCLRVKKYMFASGSAMQGLVFLSASNFDRTKVYMVSPNEDQQKLNTNTNFQNSKYYIDKITGDIYSYNYDQKQWIPKANAGLHNNTAAQSFQTLGKYILKAPTYRPKHQLSSNSTLYISKSTEIIVYIKNIHLNHYCFEGLTTPKFIASTSSKWDVHTFSFPSEEKVFSVLAESDRGPAIIEYGQHILGTFYNITSSYPETVLALKNFIKASSYKISAGFKININPDDPHYQSKQPKIRDQNIMLLLRSQSSLKPLSDEEDKSKFKHSGYAVKKTGQRQFFKNNQITEKGRLFNSVSRIGKKQIIDKASLQISPEQNEFPEQINTVMDHPRSISTLSQEEIRQLLHPKLINDIPSQTGSLWVPGQYSQRDKRAQTKIVIKVKQPFLNFSKYQKSLN